MNKEIFEQAYNNIYNFTDKFGEVMYDEINSDDNFTGIMATYVMRAFQDCQTEREFDIADKMLTAICGWNFESLVERIKEKDADPDFYWESCEKEDLNDEEDNEHYCKTCHAWCGDRVYDAAAICLHYGEMTEENYCCDHWHDAEGKTIENYEEEE